jgi:hypothetical protein
MQVIAIAVPVSASRVENANPGNHGLRSDDGSFGIAVTRTVILAVIRDIPWGITGRIARSVTWGVIRLTPAIWSSMITTAAPACGVRR